MNTQTTLFKKALSNPLSLVGFIIIVCVFLLSMLAPIVAPYDPNYIDVKAILLEPSMQHWMGTDGLGRDVLSFTVAAFLSWWGL
jgi:peptide/nickel transport system permease protein